MLPGFPMLWSTLPGEERVLAPKEDQAEGIWPLSEVPEMALGWHRIGLGHLQGGMTSLWEAGLAHMLRKQLVTSAGIRKEFSLWADWHWSSGVFALLCSIEHDYW